MADNKIRVYQNNNKTVICTVSGLDITGYTPYLTAKKNNAAVISLSKTGVVSDASTATFYLSSTDTSIAAGDYIYDITLSADSSIYTVTKDALIILDGVKY